MVRIRLPPAEGQVQTCLSREFAFLGREAAVFRGCPGRNERSGSAETRGRGNIWPKGGDISVGPYSSTAPPVMKSATMPRILSRVRSRRDVGEQPVAERADPWSRRRTRRCHNLHAGKVQPSWRWLAMKASQASHCACAISASSRRTRPIHRRAGEPRDRYNLETAPNLRVSGSQARGAPAAN